MTVVREPFYVFDYAEVAQIVGSDNLKVIESSEASFV
jgi:hypothetical protein